MANSMKWCDDCQTFWFFTHYNDDNPVVHLDNVAAFTSVVNDHCPDCDVKRGLAQSGDYDE